MPEYVTPATAPASGPISLRSSWAALSVLFVIYFFHSLDRTILGILSQPIKEELGLTDWQLGLMSGLAFTLLYITFGFPMARLADRGNRTLILSACVLVWSAMTALCGFAANFIQLCLFRAGVGVGEAGCLPASHSLISDLFPPQTRAVALSIFGLALPIGGLVGATLGGFVMDQWGWRTAFVIAGLPGIAVAFLTFAMVKEPIRGRFDRMATQESAPSGRPSFKDVATALWKSPVSRNVLIALTLGGFIGAPNVVFMGPYMIRKFGLGYTELGAIIALTFMLGSAISTIGGGLLIHWASKFDQRWSMWVPAIGVAISTPLYITSYAQPTWMGLAALMFVASIINSTYLAPSFAALHSVVAPSGRATASVIAQGSLALLGASLGPLAGGLAIDLLAGHLFERASSGTFLTSCPGGRAVAGASGTLDAICRASVVDATQIVLIFFLAFTVLPAWFFYRAARGMKPGPFGAIDT